MSDVGLSADLSLSIASALASVDELEAAITRATTGITVDLDYLSTVDSLSEAIASAVTGATADPVTIEVDADTTDASSSIDALADAPPVDVPVSADTAEAEQMILDLGDAPPVDVPVDADVTAIPGQIETAVSSVTIPAVEIAVEADTSDAAAQIADLGSESSSASEGVHGLEGSVAGLGAAAGITEGSAKELVSTIGELGGEATTAAAAGILGVGAATAGFFEEGMNAVSAGERFDLVLGDMGNKIKEIDVNGLNTNMEDLGITFGSTNSEMENANSKLFQMAINSGATKEQAILFTQQVETLSARAIALNPQLGSLADVTDQLGTKIGRGGRFAANYGLDLNAAEIATRALSDTGKTLTSDLTFAEKAMAGAELASEKYGSTLAGTVAEGQKNAAIQASELKARFKEAIEQIGVPLVSPVLDIIREAEPEAVQVAEVLGKLGHDVLPAVSDALTVIGPPLDLIGNVLTAIPGPIVAGAAAFWAMNAAMMAAAEAAYADTVAFGVLETAIPYVAAAGAALVAVTALLGDTAPYADDATAAIDTAAKGFDDLTVSVGDTVKAETEAASATGAMSDNMVRAGISTDGLSDALLTGSQAWIEYRDQILAASSSFEDWAKTRNELEHLKDQTEASAKAALDKAVNDGILTKAEEDEAIAAAGQIEGKTNYAGALDSVQPKIAAHIKAESDAKKAEDDAKAAAEEHAKILDHLKTANAGVAMTMENVNATTGDQTASLEGLAVALGNADLASADLDAVAQELGVSTQALKRFLGDVTDQVNHFVTTATDGLPNVKSAIDDALDPKAHKDKPIVIDPAKLQAEIDDSINRINAFNMQIQALINEGYTHLAQVAAERGPEFTDALTHAVDGTDMAGVLDMKFAALEQTTSAEGPKLQKAGETIVLGTGQVAADASAAFGDKFILEDPTSTEIGATDLEIDGWAHTAPAAVASVGEDAAAGWWSAIQGIKETTGSTLSDTSDAITGASGGLKTDASTTGEAGAAGFAEGIAGVPGSAQAALVEASSNITNMTSTLITDAYTSAKLIGAAFDDGLADGIKFNVGEVETEATNAVNAAEAAARKAAQTHSPSRVWASIGIDLATGLAMGIAAGQSAVTDAAGNIVDKSTTALHESIHDNMHDLGLISDDDYIGILQQRMAALVPLSDEWTRIALQIDKIRGDAVAAATSIAAEHESIHDNMHDLGVLSDDEYVAMLEQRRDRFEKFTDDWTHWQNEIDQIRSAAADRADQAASDAAQAVADQAQAERDAADLQEEILRNQVKDGVAGTDALVAMLRERQSHLEAYTDAWQRYEDEIKGLAVPAPALTSGEDTATEAAWNAVIGFEDMFNVRALTAPAVPAVRVPSGVHASPGLAVGTLVGQVGPFHIGDTESMTIDEIGDRVGALTASAVKARLSGVVGPS